MPMKITAVAAAGEAYASPFIGPVNHTATVRVDVSALTTYEVDTYGYLKPGVFLTRAGLLVDDETALLSIGTVLISATAEKFKTTTTMLYNLSGIQYSKSATDNLVFTAAHVVTALKFGIILLQINAAGTVSTKVPAATATTAMEYATSALALAALPAADADNVAFAYIIINADAGDWTANTDDMTDGSDLTTAVFTDLAVSTEETNYRKGFGAVVEATKVAAGSTSALLAAATDIDVAVATIAMLNRDVLEDILGRSLTTPELNNIPDTLVLTST